jgi:hypothetical protein
VPPALKAGLCAVMYYEFVCINAVKPVILSKLMSESGFDSSFMLREAPSSRQAYRFLRNSLSDIRLKFWEIEQTLNVFGLQI